MTEPNGWVAQVRGGVVDCEFPAGQLPGINEAIEVERPDAAPLVRTMYERLFGERDPVAEPGTATGTPGDWWTVFALVPDVFEPATRRSRTPR